MSDFLYSNLQNNGDTLVRELRRIYSDASHEAQIFQGDWGTLVCTRSPYAGFAPVETAAHLVVVTGGPVLNFRDNTFLSGGRGDAGTRAIYDRWLAGDMCWRDDLSGPFAIIMVDISNMQALVVTDMMLFLPVYYMSCNGGLILGTHVDAVARAARSEAYDTTSIVEFVLYNAITYPHTAYAGVKQCAPGSVNSFSRPRTDVKLAMTSDPYWEPVEESTFSHINEAAEELRFAAQSYIHRITRSMAAVAHFMSGGEDTRVIAGLVPSNLNRDAITFADGYNREAHLAEKAARKYGANYILIQRNPNYYLDILIEASRLVGLGAQFFHAHSLGLHMRASLRNYGAVFGGYLGDSLLKGLYAHRLPLYGKIKYLPEIILSGESRSEQVRHPWFEDRVLDEITYRRRSHIDRVRRLRPTSSHEWFELWPATMRKAIVNYHSNRRLFASFEPFMSSDVVRISASVPLEWKLYRRLFRKAFAAELSVTRWQFTTDWRLPYYAWSISAPVQALLWTLQEGGYRLGVVKRNPGAWANWHALRSSAQWREAMQSGGPPLRHLPFRKDVDVGAILSDRNVGIERVLNLLQVGMALGGEASASKGRV